MSKWCEHIKLPGESRSNWQIQEGMSVYSVPKEWNACPICLAGRPYELSQRERLARILKEAYEETVDPSRAVVWENLSKKTQEAFLDEADAAIKFFEENE